MPLIPVLAEMEMNGVLIDTETLKDVSNIFTQRMLEYERKIYELAGEEFNISSPKQVGDILFGKMKIIEKPKKTKTGQYVTSEEVLQQLRTKSPIIALILDYRGLKKLLGTYVDALPKLINSRTGHIHTSFNQAITATGRLSSSDPNLQNIPVRGEDGKEIRKCFVPEPGCLFFSADYSQIELRVMAHLSEDENMIEAFKEGYDIHAATAAKVYKKSINDVNRDERTKAKRANFGIIYGITVFGLSERLDISRDEAKQLIDGYFETFPKVRDYMEEAKQKAREAGYAETIFHRRRYLPDINSRNATVRNFAERNAINAPIQGSAADIIKVAMIRIFERFCKENIRSKMILQVHDELNFSVYPEEREKVERIVLEEMEHAYELRVPLVADCGWGNNWLEAH
jgi:DNA polymerase-1